jgi:hypothetical protein
LIGNEDLGPTGVFALRQTDRLLSSAGAAAPRPIEGVLQDVVVTFLERQKDLEGFAAVGLVAAALKEGFPCPK